MGQLFLSIRLDLDHVFFPTKNKHHTISVALILENSNENNIKYKISPFLWDRVMTMTMTMAMTIQSVGQLPTILPPPPSAPLTITMNDRMTGPHDGVVKICPPTSLLALGATTATIWI